MQIYQHQKLKQNLACFIMLITLLDFKVMKMEEKKPWGRHMIRAEQIADDHPTVFLTFCRTPSLRTVKIFPIIHILPPKVLPDICYAHDSKRLTHHLFIHN